MKLKILVVAGDGIGPEVTREAVNILRSVAEVGRTSIAHATAVGKVFLAHGGRLHGGTLKAFTDRTITDRAVLDVEIARTRETGWAQALGEREEDLNAVAAPILDRSGKLVAILGVQGPAVSQGTATAESHGNQWLQSSYPACRACSMSNPRKPEQSMNRSPSMTCPSPSVTD